MENTFDRPSITMDPSQSADTDREDTISLTSTIDEELDPEQDWEVENLHAEAVYNREPCLLIEWTGYSLNDATWEPIQNLDDGLLANWETRKEEYRKGVKPKFKIGTWRKAVVDNLREKVARCEARNRKRQRLGLEPRQYPTLNERSRHLDDYPDDPEFEDEVLDTSAADQDRNVLNDTQSARNQSRHDGGLPRPQAADSGPGATSTVQSQDSPPQEPYKGTSRPKPTDKNLPDEPRAKSPPSRPQPPRRTSSTTSGATLNSSTTSKIAKQPTHRAPPTESTTRPARPVIRRSSTADSGNVFSGGKVRKIRRTLHEAASDPSQKPQFLKSRYQRIIEKARRDKEGTAVPNRLPTSFFTLGRGYQKLPTSIPQASAEAEGAQEITSPPESTTQMESMKKKKRKSVHWEDGENQTSNQDSMDLDTEESLFMSSPPIFHEHHKHQLDHQGIRLRSPPAPLRESPASDDTPLELPPTGSSHEFPDSRNVSKIVQVGSDASKTLSITFRDMPKDPDLHWLSSFKEQARLIFKHTCTAQDFFGQPSIREVQLYQGNVSSATAGIALEALGDRLSIGSLGIFHYGEDCCVLLYPSRCEDWAGQTSSALDAKQYPLRCSIFRSSFGPSMLAPITTTTSQSTDQALRTMDHRKFCGVSYERLIPSDVWNTGKPHFFLAFPKHSSQQAILVSQWLRYSSSDCSISVSTFAGHWSSFIKLGHGTVIIHEDAVWAIRRFPGFVNLLHGPRARFSFWVFSRALQAQPMVLSIKAPSIGLGDPRLLPIFPSDIAVLVTPSFLVSQPAQAYALVKWFRQRASGPDKLVTCAGIDQWLCDLATAKLLPDEDRREAGGVSETRLKTSFMLREFVDATGLDGVDGSHVSAPDLIDGNDEQSLVNWFGWWSIMNMDRVRKFYVFGSSDSYPRKGFTRRIKWLNYQTGTVNDPTEVDARFKSAEERSGKSVTQSAVGGSLLRLIPDERALTLQNHIAALHSSAMATGWCPIIPYRIPVSYWSSDMAYHFRDYHSEFQTYDSWFRFFKSSQGTKPPTGPKKLAGYNTLGGLFYTIDGKWDPKAFTQDVLPFRRPWIALYRPVEPHRRYWEESELFIWDLTSRDKFHPGQKVYEGDLMEAQRQLIDLVRSQSPHLNLKLPLRRVWLGGFDRLSSIYTHPLEITLDQFNAFLQDLKRTVPSPADKIEGRGWRLVNHGMAPPGPIGDPMDLDDQPAQEHEAVQEGAADLKMIYHPPRGNGRQRRSKCANRLYQWSKEAEKQGHDEFEYTFRPTMEWYLEQLAEGRGFEHIKVMSWEAIFAQLHIMSPDRNGV